MLVLSAFIHRYLAPFLTGAGMAGITVVEGPLGMVFVVLCVVAFGYFSLPAGGRVIRRMAGVDAQS